MNDRPDTDARNEPDAPDSGLPASSREEEASSTNGRDDPYRVELDVFSGPLDLLLHLIRKEEIDIYDIPISRILDQYMAHLNVLQLMELDEVGDFLVMAANLMVIKARMLVPQQVELTAEDEEIEDPRSELVQKLLEYRRFKDAALKLETYRSSRNERFERDPETLPEPEEAEEDQGLLKVELWDLVEAFARIVREVGAGKNLLPFLDDDRPVREYMEEVVGRLHRVGRFHLDALFEGVQTRVSMVSYFMAILELMRGGRIMATQTGAFGPILLELVEPAAATALTETTKTPEIEPDETDPLLAVERGSQGVARFDEGLPRDPHHEGPGEPPPTPAVQTEAVADTTPDMDPAAANTAAVNTAAANTDAANTDAVNTAANGRGERTRRTRPQRTNTAAVNTANADAANTDAVNTDTGADARLDPHGER